MIETGKSRTRERLIEAAADLIAAAPGQDIPLRAICDRVGVKLPTLYHFFGSKEGLLNAVVDHGFDLYLAVKGANEESDPIAAIRAGWDAHVAFGLANPGFYALMYGQVVPGRLPEGQDRPARALRELMQRADQQGLLIVQPDLAVAHILAANIGITLRQITVGQPDRALSTAMREATIAAITGRSAEAATSSAGNSAYFAGELLVSLTSESNQLSTAENALLRQWLSQIAHRSGQ